MNTRNLVCAAILSAVSLNVNSAANTFMAGNYDHSVLVTNGLLSLAGDNNYGRLSLPVKQFYSKFTAFDSNVRAVSAAQGRTAYIKTNGDLFWFGWKAPSPTPPAMKTQLAYNAVDVALTNYDIFYISENQVWDFNPQTNTLKTLALNENPIELAAGSNHLVVRTDTGNVYTFGTNNKGQLCNGNTTSATSLIMVNTNVASIEAGGSGGNATFMVTSTGNVQMCGDNMYGLLGTKSATPPATVNVPTNISGATNIKKVAAEKTVSSLFMLNNNGAVSMIGFHDCWDYMQKPKTNFCPGAMNSSNYLVPLVMSNQIVDIGTGGDSIFLKDVYGNVLAFGGNTAYKLGDGTTTERHGPVAITIPAVTAVCDGY